jgi:hypothetical protein
MITIRELSAPKGHYAVVLLCPRGKLIATLAGPFKGNKEANLAALEEVRRLEAAQQRRTSRVVGKSSD